MDIVGPEQQIERVKDTMVDAFESELALDQVATHLGAVLDTLYVTTDGEMWNSRRGKFAILPPTGETTLPFGTAINFVPLSKPDSDEFRGLFTLTQGAKEVAIGGVVNVTGEITDSGHSVEVIQVIPMELSGKQIILGLTLFAISAANQYIDRQNNT